MNKTSRVVSFSAVIVFFILAPKWARPASFPECTTDSRDGSNIIRSAPCGVYGKVNSRQTVGATGTVLDITVDYMVHLPAGAPKALVLLFSGSSGEAGIQGDDTTHVVTQAGNNFLVRSAQLFAEAGYMAVTIDRPDPGPSDSYDQYRISPRHATDIVTVLLEVNELYHASHLDVFLAGTSRGALSVIGQNNLGIGSLLSSPVNSINGGLWVGVDSPEARLRPSFVVVPVHVLAHAQDGCSVSTAANSKKLQEDFHAAGVQAFFNSVNGGFEIDPDPCEAKAFHGFLGIEETAVKKITDRMDYFLKKKNQDFPANMKPELQDNAPLSVSTPAGTAVTIDLEALGLATDADGDSLSYSLPHSTSSRGGALSVNGSSVTYTPPSGFANKTDDFVFQVSDGKEGITNGIILIAVGVP